MNKENLLSIVTVCFENSNELRNTLTSISKKINTDNLISKIEVLVIDGSNNFDCKNVVAEFNLDAIEYFKQDGQGVYDAMNLGIDSASGDAVLFLNSGDIFASEFNLQVFLNVHASDLKEKILFGDCYYKLGKKHFLEKVDFSSAKWWEKKLPCHQSTFIPTFFLKKNPFNSNQKINADAAICRQAFSELEAKYIEQTVCIFELGGASNNINSLKRAITLYQEISFNRNLTWTGKAKLLLSLCIRYSLIKLIGFERYVLLGRYWRKT